MKNMGAWPVSRASTRARAVKDGLPASHPSSFRRRLRALQLAALLPALPIAGRLIWLQLLQSDHLSGLAAKEFVRVKEEAVLRGRILDAQGRVLAESLPAWSVFADPATIKEPWTAAHKLAPLLQVPQAELLRKLKDKGRFVWLKRKLPLEQAEAVRSLKLFGIGLHMEEERHYPNGDLGRSLLGAVSLDGDGQAGIERVFQKDLEGENGSMRLITDRKGTAVQRRSHGKGRPPKDVQLTVDASIQYFTERALEDALEKTKAKGAWAIVQNPNNGEILAMASLPRDPLKNPAVQGVYEPGSTIKFLTAVAALEEQAVTLEEKIDVEGGKWQALPSITIQDHEEFDRLDLAGIIQHSSNIGVAKLALRMGPSTYQKWLSRFGFGLPTGVGVPAEPAGLMPRPGEMRPVTLVTASYGYGIAVTPLQIVSAYSAIANGGTLYQPRLLKSLRDPQDGDTATEPIVVRQVAGKETIELVKGMLVGVVENGTGRHAMLPGYGVGGKTGTAKKRDAATGKYGGAGYVASFSGFVPSGDPRFTILVVLDQPVGGYYGGEVAAPVFAEIARNALAYKGTPQDRPAPLGSAR